MIGRARGFLARHRPLVGLLCDACETAGIALPELGLPPLRALERTRPAAARLAELLARDASAAEIVRAALVRYGEAHAAVVAAEETIAAGGAAPDPEALLAKVIALETFADAFGAHQALAEILPTTRLAPVATQPLGPPATGTYGPSREIDRLLRVEEGLNRMRTALDKLWVQVKVLQTAFDLTQSPALAEAGGSGRTLALARPLAKVLAAHPEEADAVKAFLQEFYAFQVLLQNEKARLARLKRVTRPEAPDIRETRAWFHRLGSSFHALNGRPRIKAVFFEVGADRHDAGPPPAAQDRPARVADFVARARATLAQLGPRRNILALAYQQYLGSGSAEDPEIPTAEQVASATAIAECLAFDPAEARAVAGALERYERARAALEDVERRLAAAEQAPPEERLAMLDALDLESFLQQIDPLAHFGRDFRGHPVLGRLFPAPTEALQERVAEPARAPPGSRTGGLLGDLFKRIRPDRR